MQAERLASLRVAFHRFARVEGPGLASPTYAELAYGVSMDDDLLEIAAHTRPHQPAPNMLFAAVQYLLLAGLDHPLAAHYSIIAGEERPMTPAFPHFRDFCLHHRERIIELIRTRRTQTNVVRRCTCLLPAFSIVCRETPSPLEHALVVYSTFALYQFPRASRQHIVDTLAAASAARPIWQIALEGNDPELSITRYRDRNAATQTLANASPHGWWIVWRSD